MRKRLPLVKRGATQRPVSKEPRNMKTSSATVAQTAATVFDDLPHTAQPLQRIAAGHSHYPGTAALIVAPAARSAATQGGAA